MTQFTIQESAIRPVLSIAEKEHSSSTIVFNANQNEILKVAEDGFYVRGKKVPVDDREAESVYKAFKEFLIWAALVRK